MNWHKKLKFIHWLALGIIFVVISGCLLYLSQPIYAITVSVNSTADLSDYAPGDGFCDSDVGAAMVCTLRAAIEETNFQGGSNYIDFSGLDPNEAVDGQWTFELASPLPLVINRLTLTAEDQWDDDGDLINRPGVLIVPLHGQTVSYTLSFSDSADNSRISGLTISGFSDFGLINYAEGVQVGKDCLGVPTDNQRNVFINIGNGDYGDSAVIFGGADFNYVVGNWFGLAEDGQTSLPNTPSSLYLTDSDNNIIGWVDSDYSGFVCSVEQARNILSTRTIVTNSQQNSFSGNYFNILPDGSDIIARSEGFGLYVWGANNNFIGTDGDGHDDDVEGNVFAGYLDDVYMWVADREFGGNRVSGNIFGGDPTGIKSLTTDDQELGLVITKGAENTLVGYCDDDDDSKLGISNICSNGGKDHPEYQANYFLGMNDEDDRGILLNSPSSDANNYIYGNYFGVGRDGSALPLSYGIQLRTVRDSEDANYIGDEGVRANIIQNTTEAGILLAAEYDNGTTIRNQKIRYNTITNNQGYGILIDSTKYSQNADTVGGLEITGNVLSDNGRSGLAMIGSSAEVTGNTISGNEEYGIYVEAILEDLLWPTTPSNPYNQKQTYLGRAEDLVPWPILIGGTGNENSISDNKLGGIKFLDVAPADPGQLFADNLFANNNGQPAIISNWWGAVELLDRQGDPVTDGTYTITLSSTGDIQIGSSVDLGDFSQDADEGAWGPTGFDYDEERSWFELNGYVVNVDGVLVDSGPYTINVSGDKENQAQPTTFTFDGLDNDVDHGGLSNGYLTGSVYRYQTADTVVASVPQTPAKLYPIDNSQVSASAFTLVSSDFIDSEEVHRGTIWRIYNSIEACAANGAGNVYDSGEVSDLISHQVPGEVLQRGQNYWWQLVHVNGFGNKSESSACAKFFVRTSSNVFLYSQPDNGELTDEVEQEATATPGLESNPITDTTSVTDTEIPVAISESEEVVSEDTSYDLDGQGGGDLTEDGQEVEPTIGDVEINFYIVNPDGTIRRPDTDYVEASIFASSAVELYRFEDRGEDFDYNDVLIEVDRDGGEVIQATVAAVDAGWHHQIFVEIVSGGITKTILLWSDSHEAVGQTAIIVLVNGQLLGYEIRVF